MKFQPRFGALPLDVRTFLILILKFARLKASYMSVFHTESMFLKQIDGGPDAIGVGR